MQHYQKYCHKSISYHITKISSSNTDTAEANNKLLEENELLYRRYRQRPTSNFITRREMEYQKYHQNQTCCLVSRDNIFSSSIEYSRNRQKSTGRYLQEETQTASSAERGRPSELREKQTKSFITTQRN